MSVLKRTKDFYLYVKENRSLKEQHWHFTKSNNNVSFGHKLHILDLFMYVREDKRTYVIQEDGSQPLTQGEWDWFFEELERHKEDALFLFKEGNYTRSVATGEESWKMKELYDTLITHRNPEFRIHVGFDLLRMSVQNRSYHVNVSFDWEQLGIRLEDKPRRLDKLFSIPKVLDAHLKHLQTQRKTSTKR
mgnify:CR=1 FL=1